MTEALSYEEAERLALKAIHDDGRGMIGRGRNHLHQRVARAILDAARSEGHAPERPMGELDRERVVRCVRNAIRAVVDAGSDPNRAAEVTADKIIALTAPGGGGEKP